MRLHMAPSALVGGRAWQEQDGALVWIGRAAAPPRPRFAPGDRVALRYPRRLGKRRVPAGTVVRVLAEVTARLVSVDLNGCAPPTGEKSAERQVLPLLVAARELEAVDDG